VRQRTLSAAAGAAIADMSNALAVTAANILARA
jgi:hypothetical protein